MRTLLTAWVVLFTANSLWGQSLPKVPLDDAWKARIQNLAPATPTVKPSANHKVLVFSQCTGYRHWVLPHTAEMLKILTEKSGVCHVVLSSDINQFSKDNLKNFKAIILNNNCSKSPRRHLFLDVTKDEKKAVELEENLIDFVANGGGLVGIHGSIVIFNESKKFSELLGASFDFHPRQQPITISPVEPEHPLLKAFNGKPFVHVDEPYIFNNTYTKKNFRPLLVMDTSKLKSVNPKVHSDVRYVSWIKKYGKGRVFYVSPSHNAQSFENPQLLQFYLDGIQYALGDLKCDDSPLPR